MDPETFAVTTLFSILEIPLPSVLITNLHQFIITLTTLLAGLDLSLDLTLQPNPNPVALKFNPPIYDFIIIGGGSAGCVLANRLSASNKKYKVLLLEAGGNPLPTNDVPGLVTFNLNEPETDWMYKTVPQKNSALGTENNSLPVSRGKSLGGSSTLNWMIYMRGNQKDYDNWATLTNDDQWDYDHVLPYFKQSENYKGNFPNRKYHGTDGPLAVSSQNYQPTITQWIDAAKEFAFNTTDPNGIQTSTFFPVDATIDDGRRESTYRAFLEPVLYRRNLKVIRHALVDKIKFDKNKRARSVIYTRFNQTFKVEARNEIILSAGAFGSPEILQRSGVGDSEFLKSLNISVVAHLPGVGQNLQDHVQVILGPILLNDNVSVIMERNMTVGATIEYALNHTGLFSWNVISGMGFIPTSGYDTSWPNVCVFQIPCGVSSHWHEHMEGLDGLLKDSMKSYYKEFINIDANFLLINNGRPKSVGSINISSTDPIEKPLIDPKYFSDPNGEDIKVLVEAIKFMLTFYEKSSAWQKLNATFVKKSIPGCTDYEYRSDDYFDCYIRHLTGTTWHFSGTAKMGVKRDESAVVDSNLRVFKVKGLRVVDASVFPEIPNGNLNAPTIMVAEKASKIILDEWKRKGGKSS